MITALWIDESFSLQTVKIRVSYIQLTGIWNREKAAKPHIPQTDTSLDQ